MKVPSPVVGRVREPSQAQASFSVPGADANAFGAQIGEAAKGLGTAVQGLADTVEQNDLRAANYDAIRKNSERQLKLSEEMENLQRNANPNGLDVYDNAKKLITESEQAYLSSIDPRVRDGISAQMSTTSMQALARARDFATKQQDAYATQGIEDETTRAKVATKQSPDSATQSIDAVRQHIDSSNLPETVKAQLRRLTSTAVREVEYSAREKEGQLDRLTRNPAAAVAIYVDKITQVESGGDPLASNSASSAAGLGQFLNDTWLELISEARPDLVRGKTPAEILALRYDPAVAKEMIAEYGMKNAARLQAAGVPASPANLRIAHLLGDTGAVRVLTARPDADISTLVSEKAYKANKGLFDRVPTVKALQDWAREQMGGPLPAAKIEVFQKDGYWTGPGVEYELAGKTRAKPVSREYIERVMPAIFASGEGLGIKITSAGQEPGKGVGSHRHDVNSKGEAATSDFVVTKNGKPIKPGDDPELYEKILENVAAQGFTGIGHYGWGIHVGGGSRNAWGPSTTSADLDPRFRKAIERGWARNLDNPTDALDSDLRYADITFERRQALRADGQREAQQDAARRTAEINEANNYKINNFMNAALEGKAGKADYDTLVSNGVLQDYSKRAAALRLISSIDSEAQMAAHYSAKMASPFPTTDPSSKADRDGLNALARQNNGIQRIQQLDAGHFTNAILPIAEKMRDIPTEVLGTLEGMVRSNNATQAVFALDALAQLQRTSPKAFADRVDAKLQRDVDYYTVTRRTKTDAEMHAKVNGGTTQEERQNNAILHKDAKELWIAGSEKVKKEVINAVVGSFGIPFVSGTNPDLSVLPWVNETLNKEAQVLFQDAYVQYGDVDKAKDAVVKQMNLNWGVNPVGTKNLMKFPPNKAGYQTVGGNYNWIEENARKELNLQPWQRMELISDEQTEREKNLFGPGRDPDAKPPSYQVVTYDPGGVPKLIGTKDQYGNPVPRRIYFVPDPEQKRKEIDYSENMNRRAVLDQEIREKVIMFQAAPMGPVKQELSEDLNRLNYERDQITGNLKPPAPAIYEPAPNPMGDFGGDEGWDTPDGFSDEQALGGESGTSGNGFLSWIFGGKSADVKPLANEWPSDEETASAFANGFAYGQQETLMSGEMGRVLGVDKYVKRRGKRGVSTTVEEFVPVSGADVASLKVLTEVAGKGDNRLSKIMNLSPEVKMEVAKTSIMANRIPIAALGYDPAKILLDISGVKTNISGAFSAKTDGMYANPQVVGTILHESLHRGLTELRKARPDLAERIKMLNEEMIVRFLMYKQGGDVEKGSGAAGDKQRDSAIGIFDGDKKNLELFAELNKAAAELIAKKRPGGPR